MGVGKAIGEQEMVPELGARIRTCRLCGCLDNSFDRRHPGPRLNYSVLVALLDTECELRHLHQHGPHAYAARDRHAEHGLADGTRKQSLWPTQRVYRIEPNVEINARAGQIHGWDQGAYLGRWEARSAKSTLRPRRVPAACSDSTSTIPLGHQPPHHSLRVELSRAISTTGGCH